MIQGGVLSPTLFLIIFDDLIWNLTNDDMDAYAYADDLVVNGYTEEKLKRAIKIVEEWAKINRMQINKKKSGIIFHKKRKKKKKEGDIIQIEGYPLKEEYKYLGIIIDSKL